MPFEFEKLASPAYFEENRLQPHSDHSWYPDAASADAGENPLKLNLNGMWRFYYAENDRQVPTGFQRPDFDTSGWDQIRVPGHIQLQGYDRPQYVNKQYPWDGQQALSPGELPRDFNPAACYVRHFILPEELCGKRTFLSMQGAESCAAVWLNGSYVGYSGNSFSPCEFELSDFLTAGQNTLAVLVYKWNCGSWLEDQDFFRFSGIYRDVYLYAIPELHLEDLSVTALPDDALKKGLLTVSGRVVAQSGLRYSVELLLDGELLCLAEARGETICAEVEIPQVRLWSAEKPELYTLELRLCDESGRLVELARQRVGFRRFELKDGLMCINGRRIVFRGVNRHDFDASVGRAVTREHILRDLLTMKRNNINAVRCCHYPNRQELYALCDELGLYVIAENNLESHGTWGDVTDPFATALPGDRQEWKPMLLDRLHTMVANLRNHPSILIWSVGNESFGGTVIRDLAMELRRLDPGRLVHYEGVFHDRRYSAESTDMESQMYSSAEAIRQYLREHRERPMISCEYAHAMGNACGAIDRYVRLSEEEPLYQGGFIWDFIDQAIAGQDRYEKAAYFYGGDLGDYPNDGNFSGNGLCFGDGTETPKMAEVKAVYQTLQAVVTEKEITVTNRSLFTASDEYACSVSLLRDGRCIDETALETAVPPLSDRSYPNPFADRLAGNEAGEYAVTVSFTLKRATLWAPAGYEVAFGQGVFTLAGPKTAAQDVACKAVPLQVVETAYNIGVHGTGFHLLFSKANGGLVSYAYAGRELIKEIPRPNFWRPMTDNDIGGGVHLLCAQWKSASDYVSPRIPGHGRWDRAFDPVLKQEADGTVLVTYTCHMPTIPASECSLAYRVFPDGRVVCTLTIAPDQLRGLPPMPELSVLFRMDADYSNLTWYGDGPSESYADRKNGVRLGIWSSTVAAQFTPYLRPQECGNHTGIRWARITDKTGLGLEFSAEGTPMELSALPWMPAEIEAAKHPYELPPVHSTVVRCIWKQLGVGGDDAWGSVPHPEYWLPTGEALTESVRFSFCFRGCSVENKE